jgi:hypothetical protein
MTGEDASLVGRETELSLLRELMARLRKAA